MKDCPACGKLLKLKEPLKQKTIMGMKLPYPMNVLPAAPFL